MAQTKTNSSTNTTSQGGSSSSSQGGSTSSTQSGSQSASSSQTQSSQQSGQRSESYGGSHAVTSSVGGSDTSSHSEGGSHTDTYGKSWASGKVDDQTLAARQQYATYQEDQRVTDTYNRLQETINNRPGAFSSKWDSTLSDLYDQIVNGRKFSYDFNKDALYRMYAQQYQQKGKTAMQDTLGQAQAMSGGYSNSYAQSVAQQQYQNYLQQLNDRIPELQQQAYQRYMADQSALKDQFSMAGQLRNNEYQAYRDTVSDWQADRSFDQSAYSDERNYDRNAYQQDRAYWQQEYWNQRNAEQTQMSQSDSKNWQDTVSHTDSWQNSVSDSTNWSTTDTTGWSLGQSATVGNEVQSGWSNTQSTNWQNTNSSNWSNSSTNSSSVSDAPDTISSSGIDYDSMGWMQKNDIDVQNNSASANNNQTITRNQMERQFSNLKTNDEKRQKIIDWLRNDRISESDAVWLGNKYGLQFDSFK